MSRMRTNVMFDNDFTHEEIKSASKRLRRARINAGFVTPAATFIQYGWDSMTYLQHEDGFRMFDSETADKYASAFKRTR